MLDSVATLAVRLAARPHSMTVGVRAGAGAGAGALVDTAAFLARLHAWRALLRDHGGTRFALYLQDSIEFAAALLGAWQAGKTVWLAADTLDATCASLRVHVHGFIGEFPPACAPMMAAAGSGAAAEPLRALDPEADALVVFTSGSTGAAQAIPKKLRQMASEVATLEVLFGGDTRGAAVIATVSHQHIYGLLFKVLWPLNTARPIHAASIAFPEALAPALAAGRCVLVASPAHLKRLPAHLDWQGARAHLAAVFSSGGPLPADTAQACGVLLGSIPFEVFGSSETGGIAWRRRAALPALGDEAWTPFPTVAWRLNGGFLEVRSPHLPDDAWLALADRAQEVAGRRFQLLGRGDRIAKIEEKRISLDAIEAALLASGLAAEARVALCEPEAGQRQVLAAFVVPSAAGRAVLDGAGKLALNGRLRAALSGVVDAVALPRRWRYVDALPVNAQGKTTLAALLALLEPAPCRPDLPELPEVRELERDAAVPPRRVLLEIVAPANLACFDGHFTQAPILPGVAQVEWAIRHGREHFALPAAFRAMHALKFQHVITPGTPVQLELLHDPAKGQLAFAYRSAFGQHASGRILFHGGAADDA